MADDSRRPRPAAQYGPTSEAVAANVRRVRERRGLTIYALSGLLKKAGRSIAPSAVAKIERHERQVSVDDLMALSAALNVSPSALLLPLDDSQNSTISVTGAGDVPADIAWDWLDGRRPLHLPEGDPERALLEYALWSRPPGRRRPRVYEKDAPQIAKIRQYWEHMFARGDADPDVVKRLNPGIWEAED